MSTETTLFAGLIFGSIGFGYFWYGRKQQRPIPLLCGIALMVYPYFVGGWWAMLAVGLLLMAIPYFVRP